jgi:hypothetical protein
MLHKVFLTPISYATSDSRTTEFRSGLATVHRKVYYPWIMKTVPPPAPLSANERIRLAQQAFEQYRTRCFWSMPKNFVVTEENLPSIIEGLKLDGGHKGWKLAHALCR